MNSRSKGRRFLSNIAIYIGCLGQILIGMLLSSCEQVNFFTLNKESQSTSNDSNKRESIVYTGEQSMDEIFGLNQSSFLEKIEEKQIILMVKEFTKVETIVSTFGARLLESLRIGNNIYVLISESNVPIDKIRKHQEVLFAEYNVDRMHHAIPNDNFYDLQYSLQLTGLEEVFESATGTGYTGKGVKVAVIDTGVNTLHEDFEGEDTFVEGYDFTTNLPYSISKNLDNDGHGTHVAGIIAARRNNGKGIVGIAPESLIIPYRASESNSFKSFAIAASITHATDAGADIINLSIGGVKASSVEGDAVRYAIFRGVSIVAAAGNDGINLRKYPASYPGVIVVASSNGRDEVSRYSTRNFLITITAPGEDIMSLSSNTSNNEYVSLSGTSMAAPFVSGIIALLKEKFPDSTPAQIKHILENNAKDIDIEGKDESSGYGRIQAKQVLAIETLPAVEWVEVEFKISYEGTPLENYIIGLINSDGIPLYNLITKSDGNISAFLPQGTYGFVSSYYGLSYSETIEVNTSTSSASANKISKTKNFTFEEFEGNYFRVSVYWDDAWGQENGVTTMLRLNKYNSTTQSSEFIASKRGTVSNGVYDNSIVFHVVSGLTYLISTEPIGSAIGSYRIIMESSIPISPASSQSGSTTDETNNDGDSNKELLELTAGGNSRMGYLGKGDKDFFLFSFIE